MIRITKNEDCCGCNACGDVCPSSAISFTANKGGFLYPQVDGAKCVNCGLCDKVCPMLHIKELKRKPDFFKEPSSCGAISKNVATRFDSTSGGLFTELANFVLDKGGYVGGAVWGEDFKIFQIITNEKEDLPRLRSSKYAQSDAGGFYSAVKKALVAGNYVLVCGTPCQMAALRLFLEEEYYNLFVVDFVCRGINSPLVMKKYISMFESKYGKKVIAIKQKNKELGWHRLTTKFTFEDGSIVYDPRERSIFMQGFLQHNLYCRASCYACRFKGFPRIADITLADCWDAVSDLRQSLNDDLGTSLVLCSTVKGEKLLENIADKLIVAKLNHEKILKGNPSLTVALARPTINQEDFFDTLSNDRLDLSLGNLSIWVLPIKAPFFVKCGH